MEEIKVQKKAESETELVFSVKLEEGTSSSNHKVTVARETLDQLAPSNIEATKLVRESFKFLLEREPKESILSKFDLTTIGDYFPEYEKNIRNRLE